MAKTATLKDLQVKWTNGGRRDVQRLYADLDALENWAEAIKCAVDDARSALDDYDSLQRSDFETAEEYREEREEAWEQATDAIGDIPLDIAAA